MSTPTTALPTTSSHGSRRRLQALSAAAVVGLALTLCTTTAPAKATELVPQTDAEAEQFLDDRAAEGPSTLDRGSVPEGVSVEQAQKAVEESDEITTADVEYAAAQEELPASGVPGNFYQTPDSLPSEDGAVVKQAESEFYLDPVKLIKHDAKSTVFMYKTTDEKGQARAATATLLTPNGASGHAEDAVVIAPGTQGIADKCAPSRQMGMGTEYEGISVASALAAKHPVVVVDYMGLGTEGTHHYVNRVEEGRSVLDAARAVQQLDGSEIDADTQLQLRGYSQGGHATTAALELQKEWAPELNVVSTSAGAVPTDLYKTVSGLSSVYTAFALYGVVGFADQADIDLSEFLNEKGQKVVAETADKCTVQALLSTAFTDGKSLTKNGESFPEVIDEHFTDIVDRQRLGKAEVPDIPLLVNHSRLDDVISFDQGKELASTWCRAGHKVAFEDNLGPTHLGGYVAALPRIETFTSRTFAGKAPLDSCWRL
ncbi:lipase family protein [Brevibacterium sp. JSBI002]|uniref:lipase family protein n=1 Tax=Brevibacterium sp. JSBI002 TaxID=2886045 RepID=UPI002230FA6C|nr:lipase family protein [Brevibacterium sp. JSBI002]UZD62525.1 lipase family protein [Brevibacterium sp. JSBI002]